MGTDLLYLDVSLDNVGYEVIVTVDMSDEMVPWTVVLRVSIKAGLGQSLTTA